METSTIILMNIIAITIVIITNIIGLLSFNKKMSAFNKTLVLNHKQPTEIVTKHVKDTFF